MQQENENNIESAVTDQTNTFSMKTSIFGMVYGCIGFAVWAKFQETEVSKNAAVLVLNNVGALLGLVLGGIQTRWLNYKSLVCVGAVLNVICILGIANSKELDPLDSELVVPSLYLQLGLVLVVFIFRKSELIQKIILTVVGSALLPAIYLFMRSLIDSENEIVLPNFENSYDLFVLLGLTALGFFYGCVTMCLNVLVSQSFESKRIIKPPSADKYRYLNRVSFIAGAVGLIWLHLIFFIFY